MTQGGSPAHDLGLKIRNIATSKCFSRDGIRRELWWLRQLHLPHQIQYGHIRRARNSPSMTFVRRSAISVAFCLLLKFQATSQPLRRQAQKASPNPAYRLLEGCSHLRCGAQPIELETNTYCAAYLTLKGARLEYLRPSSLLYKSTLRALWKKRLAHG